MNCSRKTQKNNLAHKLVGKNVGKRVKPAIPGSSKKLATPWNYYVCELSLVVCARLELTTSWL